MIGENLLRYNKTQKYGCFDLETTGLNLAHSKPWQASFIIFTLDEILEQHDYYLWWEDLKLSAGAAAITRFDYNYYKTKARDPKEILDIMESRLNDPTIKIVGQNWLGYDSMIVNVLRKELGLPVTYAYLQEDFKVYDTIALSKAIKLGVKPDMMNGKEFLAWQYRMLSYFNRTLKTSLKVMGKELGIEFEEDKLHDALYDIYLNAEVFKKSLWKIEI